MSKQLDIFIESLGTLLSPFVIDYNFILCKNIYKNTVDGYSGNWGSSLIYGNNIYNKDFVNIPYDEFVKAYFEILLNVEILNNNNPSDYKVVGIEYNKLEDVKVSPHCDDQNTNLECIRCFMFMFGGDFIFNINGKGIRLSETCDNILFDCTTEHYGCSTSSNPTYAIIIDLMRKDISPVEELGYIIKPLYYYMEKQCST